MGTDDAGRYIERLGNSNRENAALACIECLAPQPIPLCEVGNRTGLSLKSGDAPLNGRFGKRQVWNLGLPVAESYAGNRDVNDSAKFAATFHAQNCKPGVGLIRRWRKCPDLTRVKLGSWRGG